MSIRKVEIKIFAPGNRKREVLRYRAPQGKTFTEEGVEQILSTVAQNLEQRFPGEEYKLVPCAGGRYTFANVEKFDG